ncbi:hypothetical protein IM40_00160 [Candidatus Paracaedimonas acanthamoebae]|nr:hypothetical protein IM40_00160 [Candidatus Paracaedimonas acanthamoebae]
MSNQFSLYIEKLSKKYTLYENNSDKFIDLSGLGKLMPWKHISKREVYALNDINLFVKKGERLGIIGENGAGKSTLLKIISGNAHPSTGVVRIEGKIQSFLELGTGFHSDMTGYDNIYTYLAIHGIPEKEIEQKRADIIDFSELEDFIYHPIKTYSSGMFARLAFSVTTAIEPEIMVVDEVLSAGDAYFTGKCIERMKNLTENNNITVIFVSHDMSSIQHLCNRCIWIKNGQIIADGDPLSIVKEYASYSHKKEELRLKSKEMKISRSHISPMKSTSIDEPILFRIYGDGQPLNDQPIRIYKISILHNDKIINELIPGSTYDDDTSLPAYILYSKKDMDWGEREKDEFGSFRAVYDRNSKFQHAPFQFLLPENYLTSKNELSLEVTYSSNVVGSIEIFMENLNAYQQVGKLTPTKNDTHKIIFPFSLVQTNEVLNSPEENDENGIIESPTLSSSTESTVLQDSSKYEKGSKEIELTQVKLIQDNEDKRVLISGKSLTIELHYTANSPVMNPVFVFCIYSNDGKCIAQFLSNTSDLNQALIENSGVFSFAIDKLFLGNGHYVASVAIFKNLRYDRLESEAYHLIDRSYFFQIFDPLSEKFERGICIQPFKASVHVK